MKYMQTPSTKLPTTRVGSFSIPDHDAGSVNFREAGVAVGRRPPPPSFHKNSRSSSIELHSAIQSGFQAGGSEDSRYFVQLSDIRYSVRNVHRNNAQVLCCNFVDVVGFVGWLYTRHCGLH